LISNCQLYSEYSSRLPSVFTTIFSCPFHTLFKPPLATDFSRHFLCTVFDRSFDMTVVLQNQTFNLFSLPCHVFIIYSCTEYKKFNTFLNTIYFNFYYLAVLWKYNKPLFPKKLSIPTYYIGK